MNKRLIKKMRKKREAFNGFVYSEGNNGGDFVEIESLEDGLIRLSSGSSCVSTMNQVVPVEFLTGILQKTILVHDGDIGSVIDTFGWSQEYKDELKKKVRRVY